MPTNGNRDDEVKRSLGVGATVYEDHRKPDGIGWVTMADPEGNLFCVERSAAEPVLLVCPEFSPADAQALIADGSIAELANAKHVEFVDIGSGHWPMLTNLVELARMLAAAAQARCPIAGVPFVVW